MPDEIEAGKKESLAQQARSQRYGIAVREDGNQTKPSKWETLSDSQWGDPVNYLYPVPDKSHAANAKSRFQQNKETYDNRSRGVVRSRLNRLLRKHGLQPIARSKKSDDDDNGFSGVMIGKIELEDGDDGLVTIDAARLATFRHPWYGQIHHDEDLFESFIDNWESDVVGTELSIDAEHTRGPLGGMALAWVKDLMLDKKVFKIKAEPTDTGRQYLGKEYRYASIAYRPNFVDQETSFEFGPTLMGCAATNYPFVHRNKPIDSKFEFETPGVYLFAPEDVEQTETGVFYFGVNPTKGDNDMPKENDKGGTQEVDTTEQTQAKEPVTSLTLPDGTEITASQVQELMAQSQRNLETLKQERIDRHCDTALDRGVPPAFVNIAKAALVYCNPNADPTIEFQMGDSTQKVNFFDLIALLLENAPNRDLDEHSHRDDDGTRQEDDDSSEEKTLEDAEKDAREYRQKKYPVYDRPGEGTTAEL